MKKIRRDQSQFLVPPLRSAGVLLVGFWRGRREAFVHPPGFIRGETRGQGRVQDHAVTVRPEVGAVGLEGDPIPGVH